MMDKILINSKVALNNVKKRGVGLLTHFTVGVKFYDSMSK